MVRGLSMSSADGVRPPVMVTEQNASGINRHSEAL